MKEVDRVRRNKEQLNQLYPTFRARVELLIKKLESIPLRPRIQDAWRSPEDQRKAFESGHSKLLFGFHNVTSSEGRPEALAVDLLDDDAPLNPNSDYLLRLAAAAQEVGLSTGIRWGLPAKLAKAVDAAIANEDWTAKVKIGWDPTHVEPADFSVAEAKRGLRPG